MNKNIIIIFIMNLIISIIGTLAYSVRFVGVKTNKLALSFSLFNILTIISRVAATIQLPLLTKFIESNNQKILFLFYEMILISGLGTIIGALLIPIFQDILIKLVEVFSKEKSLIKLLKYIFLNFKYICLKNNICLKPIFKMNEYKILNKQILILHLFAVAITTVGIFSPIYAASVEYQLRATCITLDIVINGFSTILMSIFIDPQISSITDDVIEGKITRNTFKSYIIAMIGTKICGTFLSLLLLIPLANIIILIAKSI